MRHLDERVSDLVDDRLDHDERDRAYAHVATCEACRTKVELERFAKSALRTLPDVEPPTSLVQNLLSLADPGGPMPAERPVGSLLAGSVADAPIAGWRPREDRGPADRGPGDRPAGRRDSTGPFGTAGSIGAARRPRSPRQQRRVKVAAVGMMSAGALLVVLASLGGPGVVPETPPVPVSVVPPMDRFAVEHARSTGVIPFAEPASLLIPAGGPLGDRR